MPTNRTIRDGVIDAIGKDIGVVSLLDHLFVISVVRLLLTQLSFPMALLPLILYSPASTIMVSVMFQNSFLLPDAR